jgi:hypothetical protein
MSQTNAYEEIGKAVVELYKTIHGFAKRLCEVKNPEFRAGIFLMVIGGFKDRTVSEKEWKKVEDWLEKLCRESEGLKERSEK